MSQKKNPLALPYVYKIVHKITGQFYIGSRYENIRFNRSPIEDLGIYYFSSSYNKQFVNSAKVGLCDFEIILEHNNIDSVFWWEQFLIMENINNPLCLNETYINPNTGILIFCVAGKPSKLKGKTYEEILGEDKAKQRKQKQREARLGVNNPNFKRVFTKTHIEKLRNANIGKFKYNHNKIIELFNNGVSRSQISKIMGCSYDTVFRVVKFNLI